MQRSSNFCITELDITELKYYSAELIYILLLAGRVCPYDVSAQYMAASSQAIVKWHFDENVLRRISEFRVLLASSGAHDGIDGKLPIAGRDVEAGHCFQLTITTPPNKIYTPSVTAIYDDQEESKTEGKSFETNGMKLNQLKCLYCR